MILYTEEQLDKAWQYDCKVRNSVGANWIPRGMYERLFVYYLECIASGDELIKLDIHIPQDLLDTIGDNLEVEQDEEVH
tara:strand:- start:845 stop:1081 length:237 start_codon:yes stop_codon:yes gene_type:complete